MDVDRSEVQGNVLQSYGTDFTHARYLRVSFGGLRPSHVAAVLDRWRPGIAFGDVRDDEPTRMNLGFTYRGLERLQVPKSTLNEFPEDFRQGAEERATALNDRWPSESPFEGGDAIAVVYGKDAAACDTKARRLARTGWLGCRFDVLECMPAQRLQGGAEHFGFADGRSQPAVEGVDLDPVGDGVHTGLHPRGGFLRRQLALAFEDTGLRPIERQWRLLRAGEVVLGYENEDGRMPTGPSAPLGPNGTFMVYRPIQQHVDRLDEYVQAQAGQHKIPATLLREKIVGRRIDGTPLAKRRESEPGPAAGGLPNRRRANDFTYADDREGFGCPLGAHVRRSNPRDALPGGAERTMRHRIIRRGMSYEIRRDGETEKGLVFVCFASSIENGFEFIQRNWLNDGRAFGLASDPDFLLQQPHGAAGKPSGRMVIQGYRPIVLQPPRRAFVTVRGCEYLFLPSRRGCRWLTQREWLK